MKGQRVYMFIRLTFLSGLFMLAEPIRAQNLVPNPGFEEHKHCPSEPDQINLCDKWKRGTVSGSVDFFCTCANPNPYVGVPLNFAGSIAAHTGECYAGLLLYSSKYYNYQEYLQVRLLQPLVQGEEYRIKFYLCMAQNSQYCTNKISCLFSKDSLIRQADSYSLLSGSNRITFSNDTVFKSSQWFEVNLVFIASEEDNYLTIGVFKEDITKRDHKRRKQKMIICSSCNSPDAYYYIDDVEVVPTKN